MGSDTLIIIPVLNERRNLEKLVPAIFEFMPEVSILVVDDSSADGTSDFLRSLKYNNLFHLFRSRDFGYGKACIEGFKWAGSHSFKSIVTMDADFSHDYKSVPKLVEKLAAADAVVGSRYIAGGKIRNWKWHRRILSLFANLYVRIILAVPIRDMTTGFNSYRSGTLSKINLNKIKSDGYAFLVELKYKLYRAGVAISEYPIVFTERREGQSKMSGGIIWESIKLPWQLRKGRN